MLIDCELPFLVSFRFVSFCFERDEIRFSLSLSLSGGDRRLEGSVTGVVDRCLLTFLYYLRFISNGPIDSCLDLCFDEDGLNED